MSRKSSKFSHVFVFVALHSFLWCIWCGRRNKRTRGGCIRFLVGLPREEEQCACVIKSSRNPADETARVGAEAKRDRETPHGASQMPQRRMLGAQRNRTMKAMVAPRVVASHSTPNLQWRSLADSRLLEPFFVRVKFFFLLSV